MNYITVTLEDGTFYEFWIDSEEINEVLDVLNNEGIRSEREARKARGQEGWV